MSLDVNPSQEQQDKQKMFIERARNGVLRFLADKGVPVSIGETHDFMLQKFFIQHQGFSRLMEGLVTDGLVDFNDAEGFFLTDKGREQSS